MEDYRKLARLVQDGYADFSVLVDVGMPDLVEDSQLGRPQGVLLGEDEVTLEEAALVQRVRGADDENLKPDQRLKRLSCSGVLRVGRGNLNFYQCYNPVRLRSPRCILCLFHPKQLTQMIFLSPHNHNNCTP